MVSLGTRLLIALRALTCWTVGAGVAVVDRGRSGRIARSSHGPWSPPASSYWPLCSSWWSGQGCPKGIAERRRCVGLGAGLGVPALRRP